MGIYMEDLFPQPTASYVFFRYSQELNHKETVDRKFIESYTHKIIHGHTDLTISSFLKTKNDFKKILIKTKENNPHSGPFMVTIWKNGNEKNKEFKDVIELLKDTDVKQILKNSVILNYLKNPKNLQIPLKMRGE